MAELTRSGAPEARSSAPKARSGEQRGRAVAGGEKTASSSSSGPLAVERVEARRCPDLTAAGEPCPVRPLAGRARCRHHEAKHDPQLAEQVALERRLGGLRATLRALPTEFPTADFGSREGVRSLLEHAADAVVQGTLAPSQANSLAQLANVALRLAELELEARLAALELAAEKERQR